MMIRLRSPKGINVATRKVIRPKSRGTRGKGVTRIVGGMES